MNDDLLFQERIARAHGSQCGFCTPGFVMSMYALLRNNQQPTEEELEHAFEGPQRCSVCAWWPWYFVHFSHPSFWPFNLLPGNLCRCTGYRPILEGYKTFCRGTCCGNDGGCCSTCTAEEEVGETIKVNISWLLLQCMPLLVSVNDSNA